MTKTLQRIEYSPDFRKYDRSKVFEFKIKMILTGKQLNEQEKIFEYFVSTYK